MEKSFVRQLSQWRDCDLSLSSIALGIAIGVGKLGFGYVESGEGSGLVPSWNLRHGHWLAISLREDEPIGFPNKPRDYLNIRVLALLTLCFLGLSLEGDRHTEPDRF